MGQIKLQGRRFGKLLVKGLVGRNSQGRTKWRCRCDCGNFCVVPLSLLTGGRKDNCGCAPKCRRLTHNGESHTIKEWAKISGVSAGVIYNRLKDGRTIAEALTPGRLPYR